MNEFGLAFQLLSEIRGNVGGVGNVSLSWDGSVFRLVHARPETGKPVFVAAFDSSGLDFKHPAVDILDAFRKASEIYFTGEYRPADKEDAA